MSYVSLYRKWRPQRFADVTGQAHVIRTLARALERERIAHAYLFSGPRGTGKTTVARLLAKGVNCRQGPTPDPCGQCGPCERIAAGTSLDVTEIDGASNRGIDEMRDLRERVRFAPTEGKRRVYIIDEVHMLTNEAFNALLKILEEPPPHVLFVFATTEPHRVPATIVSRCQRFDFRRLTAEEVRGRLEQVTAGEGLPVQPEALGLLARHADGSLRDALGVLDQCAAVGETVTPGLVSEILGAPPREALYRVAAALAGRDPAAALVALKEVVDAGRDLRQLARDLGRHLRDLAVVRIAGWSADLVEAPGEEQGFLEEAARAWEPASLLAAVEALGALDAELRWAPQPQIVLEVALLRLIDPPGGGDDLARRVTALEQRVKALTEAGPAAEPQPGAPAREVKPFPETAAVEAPSPGPDRALGPAAPRQAPAAPKPAPAGQAGAPAPTDLAAAWQQALELLREQRHVETLAFAREAVPAGEDEAGVRVVFPPERAFHRARLQDERHRTLVERCLSRVLGRAVALVVVEAPGSEPRPPAPDDEPADPAPASPGDEEGSAGREPPPLARRRPAREELLDEDLDEPTLKAALRLFGGKIVHVEQVEESPEESQEGGNPATGRAHW